MRTSLPPAFALLLVLSHSFWLMILVAYRISVCAISVCVCLGIKEMELLHGCVPAE